MGAESFYYKVKPEDKIWWFRDLEKIGEIVFSFDKKTNYNLYRDYPYKLTKEQKELFDNENPFWAKYFSTR